MIKKYKYLAELDKHTSEICQELDGQVFLLEEAEVGINYPPMHPNCRSTVIGYFDDDTSDRFARDFEGKSYYVPSNMSYEKWHKANIDK